MCCVPLELGRCRGAVRGWSCEDLPGRMEEAGGRRRSWGAARGGDAEAADRAQAELQPHRERAAWLSDSQVRGCVHSEPECATLCNDNGVQPVGGQLAGAGDPIPKAELGSGRTRASVLGREVAVVQAHKGPSWLKAEA